jgi:hypothetical protein
MAHARNMSLLSSDLLYFLIIHIINVVVCERYGPTEQMQGGLQVRYTVCTGISKRLYDHE